MNKILIIDNSTLILNVLKDLFSKKNDFKLYIAKSFADASTLIKENEFFASISSVVLPDALDGETLELLEKNEIPTIILSSKIDIDIINIARKYNAVDYISKESIYELESIYNLIKLLVFIKDMEVLVVDDSPVIVSKIKNCLESLFLKVNTASSALEALDVLKKNPKVSFIITDHNMEEMSGLDLIKKIRKDELFAKVPVIIMTTENSNELKIKFFKNGVTDLLLKPILEEELKSKVINIFSNMKQVNDIKVFTKVVDDHVISSTADVNGVITYVSKAFCKIAGYEKEELIGKPHNIVRHPDMPSSVFKELWTTIKSGNIWKGEVKNLRRDGSFYWVKVVIEPNFDKKGNITSFTSIREDITDKKRIYDLSITDGLTSLYNRRYFNDIASFKLEDSVRNNEVFAFLLLDIDNFKKYNDTYGHQEGDRALIKVANSLKNTFLRDEDLIFRLGGEEFGVLLRSKKIVDVLDIVEKARKNIEKLAIKHEKNPPFNVITCSFGLIAGSLKDNKLELETIYKKADDALYSAKENGRNKIENIII